MILTEVSEDRTGASLNKSGRRMLGFAACRCTKILFSDHIPPHKRKSDEGNGEGMAGKLMLPLYFMGTQKRFGLPAVPVPRSRKLDLNAIAQIYARISTLSKKQCAVLKSKSARAYGGPTPFMHIIGNILLIPFVKKTHLFREFFPLCICCFVTPCHRFTS